MAQGRDKILFYVDEVIPEKQEELDISDSHYAAVAKANDAWADLEFEIDRTIWRLLRTSQPLGACVTSQLISVFPKLDALRALVEYLNFGDNVKKPLKSFHGKISKLVSRRNRMIHDKRMIKYWSKEVVRFSVSAKSELQFAPQVETEDELLKFCDTILGHVDEFEIIKRQIYEDAPGQHAKLIGRSHSIREDWDHPTDRPDFP